MKAFSKKASGTRMVRGMQVGGGSPCVQWNPQDHICPVCEDPIKPEWSDELGWLYGNCINGHTFVEQFSAPRTQATCFFCERDYLEERSTVYYLVNASPPPMFECPTCTENKEFFALLAAERQQQDYEDDMENYYATMRGIA